MDARRIAPAAVLAAATLAVPATGAAQSAPLFESHEIATWTIRAPLGQIFEHRGDDAEEYPGVITVVEPDGTHEVEVDIRTRGRSRLDTGICRFPPLRLDFPRSRVEGTLFEGQNRIKLVTHCQDDRPEHEQYVLLEYLAYRVLNVLTDYSFRVRLARISYEDSDGAREPITRYGFVIEHEETVAERTGWRYLVTPVVPPDAVDPASVAVVELFQYLIGNTDWSAFKADRGSDECCHNVKPIGAPVGPVFALPYDFDVSGLVNTRYANRLFRGNLEELGLRNVRQRLFRGLCRSAPLWPMVATRFVDRRPEIEALFREQEGLDPEIARESLEYVADFYDVVGDEDRMRRTFQRECIEG